MEMSKHEEHAVAQHGRDNVKVEDDSMKTQMSRYIGRQKSGKDA